MSLTVKIRERKNGARVVELAGRLDSNTHDACEQALAEYFITPPKKMLLELSRLEYISSMGLRFVIRLRKAVTAAGGRLVITSLQPQVADVLKLSEILPKTDIFDNSEEADVFLDAVEHKVVYSKLDMDD